MLRRHTGAQTAPMFQPAGAQAFRILVVEDSLQVRERLLEMLGEIQGVSAVALAQGADGAVRDILASRPDAVILDMRLAQGSGLDVLRAVHDAAPEIEVWMLTNFSAEPYRSACLRLGAAQFFDKSTEFDQVRERVAARVAQRNVH